MRTEVAEIKRRVSSKELFERDGIKLVHVGGLWKCCCPFHKEKTPSCVIYRDHWFCYGCSAHGDVLTYVMMTRGVGFKEALEYLGGPEAEKGRPFVYQPVPQKIEVEERPDFYGMIRIWSKVTPEAALERQANILGVLMSALKDLSCCWSRESKSWAWPMKNERSEIIGIRLRAEDGKKWSVKGSKQGLFIPTFSMTKRVFIAEGASDTAACLSLGFTAIGRPSCQGCEQMTLDFLKINRVREVVLVVDNDKPGREGARKLRERLPMKSWELLLPSKDLREYVGLGGGKELIESMLNNQVPRVP